MDEINVQKYINIEQTGEDKWRVFWKDTGEYLGDYVLCDDGAYGFVPILPGIWSPVVLYLVATRCFLLSETTDG